MSEKNIFINNKIFPKASDIFSITGVSVSSVKSKCLFVLDTNALVLPYTTSSESVDDSKCEIEVELLKLKLAEERLRQNNNSTPESTTPPQNQIPTN